MCYEKHVFSHSTCYMNMKGGATFTSLHLYIIAGLFWIGRRFKSSFRSRWIPIECIWDHSETVNNPLSTIFFPETFSSLLVGVVVSRQFNL